MNTTTYHRRYSCAQHSRVSFTHDKQYTSKLLATDCVSASKAVVSESMGYPGGSCSSFSATFQWLKVNCMINIRRSRREDYTVRSNRPLRCLQTCTVGPQEHLYHASRKFRFPQTVFQTALFREGIQEYGPKRQIIRSFRNI